MWSRRGRRLVRILAGGPFGGHLGRRSGGPCGGRRTTSFSAMSANRRRFGRVRQLPSGRFQARYLTGDGRLHRAPSTFATAAGAEQFLATVEAELRGGTWFDTTA